MQSPNAHAITLTDIDGCTSDDEIDCEQFKTIVNSLLIIDHAARSNFGMSLLSHEFRFIFQLFAKRSLIVKDASLSSQLSSRAFYELLKRMERDGLVFFEQNHEDRRAKSIGLNDLFARRLMTHFCNHEPFRSLRGSAGNGSQAGGRA